MRKLYCLLTLMIMCMGSLRSVAQPYCTVRTFSMLDNLTTNKIVSMLQDRNGLMWFTSWNGLMCYDGYRFQTFTGNGDNSHVLDTRRLLTIQQSKLGGLWCRSYYGSIYYFNTHTSTFTDVTPLIRKKTGIKTPFGHLVSRSDGTTWLQPRDRDKRVVRLKDELVVKGDANGIRLLPSGTQFPIVKAPTTFKDRQGRTWRFDDKDGVILNEAPTNSRRLKASAPIASEQTGSDNPVWLQDRFGTVWCVPRNGTFSYYDEQQHCLVPYVLRSEDFHEVIPKIHRTFVDNQGNLWFTTAYGFHLVSFNRREFHDIPVFGNQEVRSLLFDSKGELWAGNMTQQLTGLDSRFQITSHRTLPMSTSMPFGIFYIFEDSRGRKWIATKGDGLYCIDTKGSITHYLNDVKNPYSLNNDTVYCIDEDTKGHIWVGSYGDTGGLNLIDESHGSVRFIHSRNGLRHYSKDKFRCIRRITHTPSGIVIVSTTEGIVTFSDRFANVGAIRFHYAESTSDDAGSLPSNDIMQVIVMKAGDVFGATHDGVLFKIDPKSLSGKLRVSVIKLRGNVSPGLILAMQQDLHGRLWIVHENTLERMTPGSDDNYYYNPAETGGRCELTETLPVVNQRTGEMAVGTLNGIVVFNPSSLRNVIKPAGIVFTNMYFHGSQTSVPIINGTEVTLPSDRRSVTFSFAALDYANASRIRYAYKLEGVDEEWQYVGTTHQASYGHLPPGHFTLKVKSTDSEGQWLDNVATLDIDSEPTFWESWLAKVLYAIIAIAIAWLVWRYLNMRRKARVEREISEQKTKLYTDASHRLRTPLTLIGGPVTEVLKNKELSDADREQLEIVRRNARSMLEMTNDMLSSYMDNTLFVDDEHVPVFGEPDDDNLVGATGEQPDNNTRLLVVEDNDDLRAFLRSILSSDYSVITANNGQEGLEKAAKEQPDFIITDVTMPVMDGLTMVHELKRNSETSHIPIVVLSAKASLDDKLRGLHEGIDDYITKPFSSVYLKNRVANIISQRRQLQQRVVEELSAKPAETKDEKPEYKLSEPEIVDHDKEMMEKLMAYLEKHINDSEMCIEDMASAVAMNRTTLFNKVKSITGMSPVDFVRHLRMQRAMELVAHSKESFTEIAYSIGFTDSRYFSRVFKKETGMTPSEYRKANAEALE